MRNILVIAAFLLIGCDAREIDVRNAVIDRFGQEVVPLPACSAYYLARDTNGAVWFISARTRNGGLTTNLTVMKAFEAK